MKASVVERMSGRGLTCAGLSLLSVYVLYQATGSPRRAEVTPAYVSARDAEDVCRWSFDHYSPSAYEREWSTNANLWQRGICDRLTAPEHVAKSIAIVSRTQELSGKSLGSEPQRISLNSTSDVLMSRLHYKKECWSPAESRWMLSAYGVQLIEPLWGFLRDPFDFWCKEKRLQMEDWSPEAAASQGQSKAHILPTQFAPWAISPEVNENEEAAALWFDGTPPWQEHSHPVRDKSSMLEHRNIFLDLGSSYFGRWKDQVGAASGSWAYETYVKRGGLRFDKFVAVEVEKLSPEEVYKQLPRELVGVYTLMNVPLNMRKGDSLNAADLIRAITRPGDFLVLKLDIDGADLEGQLALAVKNDAEGLAQLVSELYFEHHCSIEPMEHVWGYGLKEDLDDSYRLFGAMRQHGVRAHSWP